MTTEQEVTQLMNDAEAQHRGKPQAAMELLHQAIALLDAESMPELYCRVRLAMAEIMRQQHDPECESILQEVLEITRRHSMRTILAGAHHVLGVIAYEKDNAAQAYYHLNEALGIARTEKSERMTAIVLNSLGIMYAYFGELERSMRYFMDSLKQQEKLNDTRGIGAAYGNIGALYVEMAERDLAIEYSERGLRYRIRANDIIGVVNTYLNLSTCYAQKSEPRQALKYLHDAEMHARNSAPGYLANISSRLAVLYARLDEKQTAQRYLAEAMKSVQPGDRTDTASAVIHYSSLTLQKLGRHAEALEYLGNHLTLIGSQAQLSVLENMNRLMADLLSELNRDEEAERYTKSADRYYTQLRDLSVVREIRNLDLRRQLIYAENIQQTDEQDANRAGDEQLPGMALKHAAGAVLGTVRNRLELHRRSNARGTTLLDAIRTDIKQLVGRLDSEAKTLAQSTIHKIDEALGGAPGSLLSEEQLNEHFQLFSENLRQTAPNLTPTELRVCLLVRLEFRSKEIAELLFCASPTVSVHRRNIRKKLQLPPRSNLTNYLNSLPI